jgi:cyclohexadienyl dehydratase
VDWTAPETGDARLLNLNDQEKYATVNVIPIFDCLAEDDADVMITDASEARFQQKLHTNVLRAIHSGKRFDFDQKAFWMVPEPALKASVDQRLHLTTEDGEFDVLYGKWFR